jgi:YHS domain-containing protein
MAGFAYATCGSCGIPNGDESVSAGVPVNSVCPVTGMKITKDDKYTTQYDGKVIGFCCPDCIEKFNQDPKKYMKIVDQNIGAN